MEEDKGQRLALMKAEDDITAKRIEDTYRHLVQFKDTTDYMAEESSHDTSKLIEFEMGSPCVTSRGVFIDEDLNFRAVFIEEDLKSFPILSSTENVPESGGIESWMNGSLAPFVHQPPQCENSTDDTEPKSKETRHRSPTKKKRRVIFPEESSTIATDIDVEGQPQTDLRQHKVKNNKNNRKARQRPSYNSLLKNYTIHLAQAEKDYGTSYMVEHHTDQPTAVKPIHCSVINLCFDEINIENTGANEWSKLEDRAENNDLKETDLATEERQIMSVVMDDVAALQDNLSPNDTIETHDTYPIPTGVGGDSPKYEENLTCYTEPMFLSDLNEPSTSKGVRHINMDAQCGPDTVSIDCPLMSRTPSINLQKVCKTGIYIGDSSTDLNIKKMVNFATSTSEYGTKVYYGNGSTENAEILPMETLLKTMCDTSTLPWTTKRNNYEHSNTKFAHKHVSSATTDSCTILNDVNLAKYKEMPVSISMIDENCQSPSRYNCAIEAKLIKAVFSNFNKMDDSLSDHSTVNATSSRLFETPSIQKEVHSNDNSKHALRTLYDKQYAPPKLSFVGAHVHSYKERGVSEDILYQGVWQKHRTLWAPKKRSLGDIAKKTYITRKENSKEKIKSVRSRSSPSDLKNCSASVAKRTPLRLSASKDFISKNIILSSSGRAPKAKKSHTLKRPAVAKLKQCNFNEKAALVFDSKNQLSSPIVVKKEHSIVTETKRDIAVMRNDPLRPHLITANSNETMKDMNIPDCFSYSIAKQQIVSNNATAIERKPDVLSKNASIVETEFMQNNPTVVETKIDVISKNGTMVETTPSKTAIIVETKSYDVIPNDATVVETTPNFVANWLTPVETKPDFRSNHAALAETQSGLICNDAMRSEFKPDLVTGKTTLVENKCGTVKIQPCFPNYTKIIEMQPESASNDAEAAQADPEFMSNFESLAKLKQDIISSNEVLARLQQDFEQKVEKRILGTKARHVLNKKPNKVPSRSRLSTTPQKLDNIRQTKKSTSTLRSTPLRPKVDQKKTPGIPIKTTSKTLIRKMSLKNLKSTKGHQKTTNVSLSAPKAKKTVNFKDPIRITRPSSALPAIALTKAPVKVNSQQPLKAKVNPHIRPRSADTTGVKPQVSRPLMKRSIWMPKQSAETQKLTKDVLKVHDESHPERNYLVYCSEVDSSDSTDCSILYEDPDIIMSKFYSSSSRTSSNCSSPNSIVTVRSRLKRHPGLKSPLSKNTPSNKDDRKTLTPKSATNRHKYNMTTNKDFNVKPRPAPKVNANEKYAAQKGGRAEYKNVFVAQLSSEAASPLQSSSPKGRKCLSPNGCTSPKKILKKAILKIKDLDEDIILNEKSIDSFLAPQQSLKTMSHDDIPQIHRVSDSKSNQEVNQSAKEVVILESKICDDVTGATYSEITSVMREIIEDTLIEIDETIGQRSKWPDFCAKPSSVGVPSKKKFDSSQSKNSSMLTDVAEMQKHNISIAENTRGSSIKDLYERKEQLTFKPAGPLAIQAFSGFSMNSPPPVGDQKPDYVNLVDSETGSVATAIPTRLAASEELYISGRSSESYQSCLVDEEMVVPDWLFRVVSQNQDNAEYDDDEENYPMPMPTGVPVPPIALQEFDINGNIAEGAPTVARTGAGDGRGIHSDQSQHSSGHGTSLSSSANSSGPDSTMVIDPSGYPSRYDSMLESLSDDDDAEAESSNRPVCQLPTGPGTPMSSTERIYTLLHQAATSDVDADVSSMGTDDNVSRNHEL